MSKKETSGRRIINGYEVIFYEVEGLWYLSALGSRCRLDSNLYSLDEALNYFTSED